MADVRKQRQQSRRTEAVSLRLAGLTWEQIGERLDINASGARDLVNRTLTAAENLAVEQMRDVEGARLDRAQAAIWTKVLEGDLKAVDTFLRISQRRSKLFGMDAPLSLNVSVGVRREMEDALDQLQTVVMGTVVSSSYLNDDTDEETDGPPALDS